MAIGFLKCVANFTLKDSEDEKSIKIQNDELNINGLEVLIDTEPSQISFRIQKKDIVTGNMDFKFIDDKVIVSVDAIFKVNVKSGYTNEFLDPSLKWIFNKLLGENGKFIQADYVDGLKVETVIRKNHFIGEYSEDKYLLNIITKNKKIEFND